MDMIYNLDNPSDEKIKPILLEYRRQYNERVNWDIATYEDILNIIRLRENNVWSDYISYCRDDKYTPDSLKHKPILDNVRWVSVFCVHGGSEGIYLHIEFIYTDSKRELIFLGKTLSSGPIAMKECYESAGRLAVLLMA